MDLKASLVLTTINAPNAVMKDLAIGAKGKGIDFYIIGDVKSPQDFSLEDVHYFNVKKQRESRLDYATTCPTGHYARKNIGYLLAIRDGAELIIETDDDNFPRRDFFSTRTRRVNASFNGNQGWVNVYHYFSDANIWPRGFPLQSIHNTIKPLSDLPQRELDCPIQQGLADENPDVDAIFRMVSKLPQNFSSEPKIALGKDTWCPFNSQNTTWWRDAFPLLYLPAYCSFRMTDIWRSFVAQRIAWENGWSIFFHGPTVWQERNEHNLIRDFTDEIPGYLHNEEIVKRLSGLDIAPGKENIQGNLLKCYKTLIEMGLVGKEEVELLELWGSDLQKIGFSLD